MAPAVSTGAVRSGRARADARNDVTRRELSLKIDGVGVVRGNRRIVVDLNLQVPLAESPSASVTV